MNRYRYLCVLFAFAGILLALVSSASGAVVTIAEARSLPLGSTVTIGQAVITNTLDMISSDDHRQFSLRDDTGAVTVWGTTEAIEGVLGDHQVGDVVSFTAVTEVFRGLFDLIETEDQPFDPQPAQTVVHPTLTVDAAPVDARPIDFADYSPTAEGLESELVRVSDIRFIGYHIYPDTEFLPIPPGSRFEHLGTYLAEDASGTTFKVWVRSRAIRDRLNSMVSEVPVDWLDVEGIFTQFDPGEPGTGVPGQGYVLMPTSLPEPAGGVLLVVGAVALLRRRRA